MGLKYSLYKYQLKILTLVHLEWKGAKSPFSFSLILNYFSSTLFSNDEEVYF